MGQYAHTAKSRSVSPAFALVHVRYIVGPALVWAAALAAVVATSLWPAQPGMEPDAAQQSSQQPVAEPTGGLVHHGA